MNKQELQEKILSFMRADSYKPLTEEDILKNLALGSADLKTFWAVAKELEEMGAIIRTRFNTYGLPEKMSLVPGILNLAIKGFGFVTPSEGEDIFIPPSQLLGAMNGDQVIARISSRPTGRQPEGEVIRILKRAHSSVVGAFNRRKEYGFVLPDDKKIGQDIFIAKKNFNGAKDGQKVVAELTVWPENGKNAEGRIAEILGNAGDPGLEVLAIIKQHGLPLQFPDKVLAAAKKINKTVAQEELGGRRDLRQRFIVTIDSEDAQDLDDAVYVETLSGGGWLLGVYIADVSHYVAENSLLDQEAKDRGTSVYLVDRVLPMLPERLSNGICSLNAGEDRLVMACEMEINRSGRVTRHEIFPSVINVGMRLSYSLVKGILADNVLPSDLPIELAANLKNMASLSEVLRKKRMARGAIDFDFPEQKVKLDQNGKPLSIEQRVRTIAESIIEEFMLAANETVAEQLFSQKTPSLYRIHEPPNEEKIAALSALLQTFSLRLPVKETINPGDLQALLRQISGRPEEKLISKVVLRSLKQAEYRAENLGHFGLAAKFYTHFTSPIRRYPDLVVHRMLKESAQKPPGEDRLNYLNTALPEIAKHASKQERAAEQAERDTVDLKKAEYMLDFIGDSFDGTVSGVTAFGLFVELENGVEGLLHMSALTDDYYVYIEEKYCLLGETTKKVYRIGDSITVEVLNANIASRSVDFILPGETAAVKQQLLSRSGQRPGGEAGKKTSTKKEKPKNTYKKSKKKSSLKIKKRR